jgi:hypothetical protein
MDLASRGTTERLMLECENRGDFVRSWNMDRFVGSSCMPNPYCTIV